MTGKGFGRLAAAFLAAVLATAVLGSVVGTQINLAPLAAMGVAVPPGLRLLTTAQDLAGFGFVMAALAAAAFLPAFLVAGLAGRMAPAWRRTAFVLAGAAGLLAAFVLMGFFTPMPTLIAAVRGPAGLAAMSATGLVGGFLFARLSARPADHRRQ